MRRALDVLQGKSLTRLLKHLFAATSMATVPVYWVLRGSGLSSRFSARCQTIGIPQARDLSDPACAGEFP